MVRLLCHIVKYFRKIERAIVMVSVVALSFVVSGCGHEGTFEISTLLTEGAVLQQQSKVLMRGKAIPGTTISIWTDWDFTVSTSANSDSTWSVLVSTPVADNNRHSIIFTSGDNVVELHDVLIGEVWIASGQSNMGMPLIGWGTDTVAGGKAIQAEAQDSLMRFFLASQQYSLEPMRNLRGRWWPLCPATSDRFSGAAYSFARDLRDSLNVPVGIVQCPFGGATCRTWVSPEDLKDDPNYESVLNKYIKDVQEYKAYAAWLDSCPSRPIVGPLGEDNLKDISIYDEYITLSMFDFSKWPTMQVPGYWENHGLKRFDGVVWFMRKVTIPDSWVGKDLRITLGRVDDRDVTYVNQFLVGAHQDREMFSDIRSYKIPANIVRSNVVSVAVRVIDERANGGIVGNGDGSKMCIELPGSNDAPIDIEGDWAYCVVAQIINGHMFMFGMPDNKFVSRPNNAFCLPNTLPSVVYNGMIAPLKGFSAAGVIWHHGEGDVWDKNERLFSGDCTRLIVNTFRRTIGRVDLPFVVCQMSPGVFHGCHSASGGTIRERQHAVVNTMDDNVVLIPTLDLGSMTTLRPPYKIEQGRRMARQALAKFYGKKGFIPNGPMPVSATSDHYIISVQMENADGIYVDTSKPCQVEVAGADTVYYPAKAMATSRGIAAFSHMVPDPLFVRYGHYNCCEPTVWNSIGIPCPSFSLKADYVESQRESE